MIVVSDTSPIRALHFLRLMELLPRLYGEVFVPPAVAEELGNPRERFEPVQVSEYSFITVQAPRDMSSHSAMLAELDAGESAALALAVELHADYVLIDETDGRAIASRLGLTATGVVGVLGRAKRSKIIPLVRPLLDNLEGGLGFFLGKSFKEAALHDLGE